MAINRENNLFLLLIRRIFGTKQIQQQQQLIEHRLQRLLCQQQELHNAMLSLGNAITYSATDSHKIKSSAIYLRCAEIISLLSPMDVEGANFVRVGRDYDGGYVMLDDFRRKIEAAYSFGISDDISWDDSIARRGIDVFMYDHTIEHLPWGHPRFHYFKTGVTGHKKGDNLKTVTELVTENNHASCRNMLLKMDVEGCEWDILQETPSTVLGQFSQIVTEFHGLTQAAYDSNSNIPKVLAKINQTHQCIHIHANSTSLPLWIGELVLPSVLEVTYIRRTDFVSKFINSTRQFPTKIDQPTFASWPDIYLGDFSTNN